MKIPKDQRSSFIPHFSSLTNYGAKYRCGPEANYVLYPGLSFLDTSKSVIFAYPSSNRGMFSGLRSAQTISLECSYYKPRMTHPTKNLIPFYPVFLKIVDRFVPFQRVFYLSFLWQLISIFSCVEYPQNIPEKYLLTSHCLYFHDSEF